MRKVFSITNSKVLEKIEKQQNQSKYIQELVLRDIYNNEPIYKKELYKLLIEVIHKLKLE